MNVLKPGYESHLDYVIYNGPPNTICRQYTKNLNIESNLVEAVTLSPDLFNYIDNPSENVICAYIERNYYSFKLPQVNITKKIYISLIVQNISNYKKYNYELDNDDIMYIVTKNHKFLECIENQSYDMIYNAIKVSHYNNQKEITTNIFYGNSISWLENISSDFPKLIKSSCFTSEEITELYKILYKINNRTINAMDLTYVDDNTIIEYAKNGNNDILSEISTERLKKMESIIIDNKYHKLYKYISDKILKKKLLKENFLNGNLYDFPEEYADEDIIAHIINKKIYRMYNYINDETIKKKVYQTALLNGDTHSIPEEYIDNEIIENLLLKKDKYFVVPKKLQTLDNCVKMVECNFSNITKCYYFNKYILFDLVKKKQLQIPRTSRYWFIENMNEEQMIKILEIAPYYIQYTKHQTKTMIVTALNTSGYVLEYIKEKTPEYIELALKNEPKAIKFSK